MGVAKQEADYYRRLDDYDNASTWFVFARRLEQRMVPSAQKKTVASSPSSSSATEGAAAEVEAAGSEMADAEDEDEGPEVEDEGPEVEDGDAAGSAKPQEKTHSSERARA